MVINKGWYMNYFYQTRRVDGLPAWTPSGAEVFPPVELRFRIGHRTRLADFEGVHQYTTEHCQQDLDDWEAPMRWKVDE